jgi:6-phosphogluconolactonase
VAPNFDRRRSKSLSITRCRIGGSRPERIVSGEKSDTISAYAIDEASGAVKLIGKYPAGKGANWVEIVSFD